MLLVNKPNFTVNKGLPALRALLDNPSSKNQDNNYDDDDNVNHHLPQETEQIGTTTIKGRIVLPGDSLHINASSCLPGSGLMTNMSNGELSAVSCGLVKTVNKLLYISTLNSGYMGAIGDVVVGRINEVGQGKWYLDIGGNQMAHLNLTSIALPKGELRRKTEEELSDLRQFFSEGDVVLTEIQRIQPDGTIQLHSRNERYGLLKGGSLIKVSPAMVPKQPQHILTLANDVYLVLGHNGYIWIGAPPQITDIASLGFTGVEARIFDSDNIELTQEHLRNIARARNAVVMLSAHYVGVTKKTVQDFLAKTAHLKEPHQLLFQSTAKEVFKLSS